MVLLTFQVDPFRYQESFNLVTRSTDRVKAPAQAQYWPWRSPVRPPTWEHQPLTAHHGPLSILKLMRCTR